MTKKISSRKADCFGFKIIENTADIGISVWGNDMAGLFSAGLTGCLKITAGTARTSGTESIELDLSALDSEELLIKFLNEILYLINVRRWLPAGIIESTLQETASR